MGRGTDRFMLEVETSLLSTGMDWEMKGSPDASLDQFPKKEELSITTAQPFY